MDSRCDVRDARRCVRLPVLSGEAAQVPQFEFRLGVKPPACGHPRPRESGAGHDVPATGRIRFSGAEWIIGIESICSAALSRDAPSPTRKPGSADRHSVYERLGGDFELVSASHKITAGCFWQVYRIFKVLQCRESRNLDSA